MSITGTRPHMTCQTEGCNHKALIWVNSPEGKAKHVCWDCTQELTAVGWTRKW